MKRVLINFILVSNLFCTVDADVLTVSNDAKAPAQYTDINTAIAAATPGDTIMVYGSGSTYSTVNLNREVVLIGAGYNNPYGGNSIIGTLNLKAANPFSASNSKISGFQLGNVYFTGTSGTSKTIEGVTIERCHLTGYYYFANTDVTYRNDTLRNCLLSSNYSNYAYFTGSNFENVIFHNNIFDSYYLYSSTSYSSAGVVVKNNVFINRASNNVFVAIKDLTIENNIFYAAEPQGCTNCAFNNNLTYANSQDTLVGSGNPGSVGSGNLYDVNPLFEVYPIGGGGFSYSHDLTVNEPSAQTAGTDGTVIGIQGGLMFFVPGANPAIPQMTEVSFPGDGSSVKVGGTLDVTFKAIKQD